MLREIVYVSRATSLSRQWYRFLLLSAIICQNRLADKISGWKAILETLSLHDPSLSRLHTLRLCEQHTLLETHQDFQQLHLALTNLPSLQEIKLLRLQDEADEQLISSIDHRALNTQNLQLSWNSACARAITNLSTALLHSQHKSIRFTGPQLSPEASLQLLQVPLKSIASVASRLRGLDVTFTSDRDVTTLIARLSNAFNHFLHAAANLTSIHIGFPPLLPLNLELDAIFHGITLKNVHKLSLQGWRLASHEITALACRHRYTLRELRLCAVYLRPGGRWGDVLSELREEMGSLERVRLQDIDYERHFEDRGVADGVEVMDVPSAEAGPSSHPDTSQARVQGVDRVPAVVEPEWFESRDMLVEVAGLTADDLGDDGIQVRQEQIPLWETWVLARRNGMSNGHLC